MFEFNIVAISSNLLPTLVVADKGSFIGLLETTAEPALKYKLTFGPQPSTVSPPITGALVMPASRFVAWQPSTWPATPAAVDDEFIRKLKQIFEE